MPMASNVPSSYTPPTFLSTVCDLTNQLRMYVVLLVTQLITLEVILRCTFIECIRGPKV